MEIWECLYNAQNEGELFLPPHIRQHGRHDIEEFVNTFDPTPEQKEKLEYLLNVFYANSEKTGFRDGVKIALRLYSE